MFLHPIVRATSDFVGVIKDTTNAISEFNSVIGYLSVPADYVTKKGTLFKIKGTGHMRTKSSSPGTITTRLSGFGKTSAMVISPSAGLITDTFTLEGYISVKVVGAVGQARFQTLLFIDDGSGTDQGNGLFHYNVSSWSDIDFTATASIDLTVEFDTADPSNEIQLFNAYLEEFNA